MTAPAWTHMISNKTVCTFFFGLFFLTTLAIAYIVFPILRTVIGNPVATLPIFVVMLLISAHGIASVLFPYILCVRSLD